MSDSLRCPFCGWTGAARRTGTSCEYVPEGGPGLADRGPAVRQTDSYECEVCAQVWDDESYRRPQDPRTRSADGQRRSRPAVGARAARRG